jgi:hypothetical protein
MVNALISGLILVETELMYKVCKKKTDTIFDSKHKAWQQLKFLIFFLFKEWIRTMLLRSEFQRLDHYTIEEGYFLINFGRILRIQCQ